MIFIKSKVKTKGLHGAVFLSKIPIVYFEDSIMITTPGSYILCNTIIIKFFKFQSTFYNVDLLHLCSRTGALVPVGFSEKCKPFLGQDRES
jgi:hypothetical protein